MPNDVSELDVTRSAWLLIRQHGAEARARPAGRARELAEAGDHIGAAVYLRIMRAIVELQRGRDPTDPLQ
jgi:hypothetical protein